MPIISRLLERRSGHVENPATSLSDPGVVRHLRGAEKTFTGRNISPESSLLVSGVYACVRIIAEGVSQLPVDMTRKDGKIRKDASDHPVAHLVTDTPNPEADVGEFWRSVLVWVLLRGNAYVYIQRDGNGWPQHLWVLPAYSVLPLRTPNTREIVYQVVLSEDAHAGFMDRAALVPARDVLHFKAFGLGRLTGLSPIAAMRESVGIALAAQEYQGRFYANDATPGGYISVPESMSDAGFARLEQSWLTAHQGLASAHKPAVLDAGAEWKSVGLNPDDAEFIGSRKWELSEIARMFGVPPHMLGDQERQTSYGTGVDEQNRGFAKHTLMPWTTRLERVTRQGLLLPNPVADRQLRVRWDMNELLRGDPKSRSEAHAVERQWGWKSINDIREDEGLEPIPGGDMYLEPENMRPVLADDEEDTRGLQRRIDAAGALIRAGFDPESAAKRLDLDVEHLGVLPVTVQADRTADAAAGIRRTPQVETRASEQVRSAEVDRHLEAITEFFGVQRDDILSRITGSVTSVSELWDIDRWDDELAGMFRRLAGITAASFARQVDADYDPDQELGGWLAANSRIAAEEVNRSNREYLDGHLESAGEDDDRSEVLSTAFAVIGGATAAQIARTRVTTVGQAAQQDAAEKSATVTEKTWRVTSDNPRGTHSAMDGETVPVGERFSNGARYPGDPELPTEERSNCSCDMDLR